MRRFTARAALLAVAALAVSVPAFAEGPKTDNDKAFYSFGFNLSQQLSMLNLTPAEFEQIKTGLSDGVMKKTPQADVTPKLRCTRSASNGRRRCTVTTL